MKKCDYNFVELSILTMIESDMRMIGLLLTVECDI